MHLREAIRAEAAAAIAGLASTGSRVNTTRFFALDGELELPCWCVATGNESVEVQSMGGVYGRELELVFVGIARQPTGAELEQLLDTMGEELETAIDAHTWANADYAQLTAVEFDGGVDDRDQPIGALTVRYTVRYATQGAPSA